MTPANAGALTPGSSSVAGPSVVNPATGGVSGLDAPATAPSAATSPSMGSNLMSNLKSMGKKYIESKLGQGKGGQQQQQQQQAQPAKKDPAKQRRIAAMIAAGMNPAQAEALVESEGEQGMSDAGEGAMGLAGSLTKTPEETA